jgi:hypothetical protein
MAKKNSEPKNAREIALAGCNLSEGFSFYEETFIGAHTVERRGEFEPDGSQLTIPFTARIKFGRPRPVVQGGRS